MRVIQNCITGNLFLVEKEKIIKKDLCKCRRVVGSFIGCDEARCEVTEYVHLLSNNNEFSFLHTQVLAIDIGNEDILIDDNNYRLYEPEMEIINDYTNSKIEEINGKIINHGKLYTFKEGIETWYRYVITKKEATEKPIIKKGHTIDNFINLEVSDAIKTYGKFNSSHEAYAVLLEEIEEVGEEFDIINDYIKETWNYVRRNQNDNIEITLPIIEEASRRMIKELVQVIAVVRKTLMGIEDKKEN
jgi:hypothetical protein